MTAESPVPEVLILSEQDVKSLLSMSEALAAVERAFKLKAEGKTAMPPKLYLDLPEYQGDFRAMPAYIDGVAGVKWVSVYPGNRTRKLQTVVATIILNDPHTGYPLAVMDGMYITNLRTGAGGGVAAKYLARKNSTVVGILGAGAQARTQLMAICELLPGIKEVKAFDLRREAAESLAREMGPKLQLDIHPVDTIEQAAEADIIVAATPARQPILMKPMVRPGTHINAIGADARGKQELEPDLLKSAKIVADDIEQATHAGEMNVPFTAGLITLKDIYGTLGEVVAGLKPGRTSDDEITVFDSTGLAIEDIICARLVYEKAKGKRGITAVRMNE